MINHKPCKRKSESDDRVIKWTQYPISGWISILCREYHSLSMILKEKSINKSTIQPLHWKMKACLSFGNETSLRLQNTSFGCVYVTVKVIHTT